MLASQLGRNNHRQLRATERERERMRYEGGERVRKKGRIERQREVLEGGRKRGRVRKSDEEEREQSALPCQDKNLFPILLSSAHYLSSADEIRPAE